MKGIYDSNRSYRIYDFVTWDLGRNMWRCVCGGPQSMALLIRQLKMSLFFECYGIVV